jgi:hypothetical protein
MFLYYLLKQDLLIILIQMKLPENSFLDLFHPLEVPEDKPLIKFFLLLTVPKLLESTLVLLMEFLLLHVFIGLPEILILENTENLFTSQELMIFSIILSEVQLSIKKIFSLAIMYLLL